MEKITVVACEVNAKGGGYDILLSNGETVFSPTAYVVGVEYEYPTSAATADKIDFAYDPGRRTLSVLINDVERMNAPLPILDKLADELRNARGALAALSEQNGRLAEEILRLKHEPAMLTAPPGLVGVTTRNVADLPPLDALTSHLPMEQTVETDTRTDVEKHLDAKRAAVETLGDVVDRTLPAGLMDEEIEGTNVA